MLEMGRSNQQKTHLGLAPKYWNLISLQLEQDPGLTNSVLMTKIAFLEKHKFSR